MINHLGQWEENKDYTNFPKTEWCDMDYMAVWIRSQGYEPKTSMENLILMVLAHYDNELAEGNEDSAYLGYFAIPEQREWPDNLMINIPDVEAYVEASGGLEMFDFIP